MNIQTEKYQVTYDPPSATMTCKGSFRLHTPEYNEILSEMNQSADTAEDTLILDIRELRFLNSSGINWLYKFVRHVRDRQAGQLTVLGSRRVPWQMKTLRNLEKLWPGLQLEME
jgi:hypothetical protein